MFIQAAWQDSPINDLDPNFISPTIIPPCARHEEGAFLGRTLNLNAIPGVFVHNTNLVQGGEYAFIYKETIQEAINIGIPIVESLIVAHEIGHQFGLGHGDVLTPGGLIPKFPNTGLMHPNIPTNLIIPRHKNLLRSREQAPGH